MQQPIHEGAKRRLNIDNNNNNNNSSNNNNNINNNYNKNHDKTPWFPLFLSVVYISIIVLIPSTYTLFYIASRTWTAPLPVTSCSLNILHLCHIEIETIKKIATGKISFFSKNSNQSKHKNTYIRLFVSSSFFSGRYCVC